MGAVIIAGRYVPRPPEDNIWDARPKGIAPLRMPVGGGFPFVNQRFAFNCDEATVWYRNGSSFAALRMPIGGGFPFVPARWKFDYDDAGHFLQKSFPVAPVNALVGGNFPFVPKRWAQDYDDASRWQRKPFPVPPVRDLVGGNFPFVNWRFSFGLDDHAAWDKNRSTFPTLGLPVTTGVIVAGRYVPRPPADELWTGKPTPVSPLYTITAAPLNPFLPKAWRFDYDQPREWVGHSGSAFWVLDQSFQLYAPGTTRQFPPGEEPNVWIGNKVQVNNSLLSPQAVVNPFPPSRWKYDNDESAVWYAKPGNIPVRSMPIGGGFPFVPARWKFDYDDASLWTVQSFAKPSVQSLVGGGFPLKPAFWAYNNDDSGTWRGFPANVSIIQQLVVAKPLLPTTWKFDYDLAAFWSGAPSNVPITITQPLPPVAATGGFGGGISYSQREFDRIIRLDYEEWKRKHKKNKKLDKAVEAAIEVLEEVASKGLLAALAPAVELKETIETLPAKPVEALIRDIREQTKILEQMLDDEEDILLMIAALD